MSKIFDEDKKDEHESYGLVQMNRIDGQFSNLFGTNVDSSSAVALRIKKAYVERGLNKNWIHGNGEYIEVILSPNQFSELLTTMNHGQGVPCTIQHISGKRMEQPPARETEPEQIRAEFKEKVKELDQKMDEFGQKIVTILDKKSILKADRDEIRNHLRMLHREIGANFPFVLKQFNRSTEKIVKEAKSVVDAFVTQTINRAGIKAIKDGGGIVSVPKLESKDE